LGNNIGRILVDNGSAADISFKNCYFSMGFKLEDLDSTDQPLYGFGGKKIEAIGKKKINVTFGEGEFKRTEEILFDIVDIDYPYNAIFGRGIINKFQAVIHQGCLCMKMPTPAGVLSIYGSQKDARDAEMNASLSNKNIHSINATSEESEDENLKDELEDKEPEKAQPHKYTKKVPLCEDTPDKCVTISATLSTEEEEKLIQCLRNNQEVFAWKPSNLVGVSRSVIEHKLHVDPNAKPRKQRLRATSEERAEAAKVAVHKLLDADVIEKYSSQIGYQMWSWQKEKWTM
jgi:hypothetical protein